MNCLFQACASKSSLLRVDARPSDPVLQREADRALHRCLRAAASLLGAYHQHLPLSSGDVYPPALRRALEELSAVATAAAALGHAPDLARELAADVHRLGAAAEKHWGPRETTAVPAAGAKVDAGGAGGGGGGKSKKTPPAKKVDIGLINNLAREKFGAAAAAAAAAATSPKKTNLKRQQRLRLLQSRKHHLQGREVSRHKVILPKGNRLLEERARRARERRFGEEAGGPSQSSSSVKPPLQGTASLDYYFSNIVSSLRPPPHLDFPFSPTRPGPKILNLDNDELGRPSLRSPLDDFSGPDAVAVAARASRAAASLVGLLSDRLAEEVVRDVCAEMSSADMVDRLFRGEFRE